MKECFVSIFLDLLQLKVDPSPHCVHNRFGLLEDLLLHEGGEVALHDLLDLHLEGGDLPRQVALPVVSVDGEDSQLHGRHIVVLQEDHLERSVDCLFLKYPESRTAHPVSVLDDGGGIACKEILDCVSIGGVDLLSLGISKCCFDNEKG